MALPLRSPGVRLLSSGVVVIGIFIGATDGWSAPRFTITPGTASVADALTDPHSGNRAILERILP